MDEIHILYSSENESYTNLKKSSKPLVSVYTSTYNRGYVLSRAFESLCNQTYDNFEWIIVDGGSNDDTQNIVEGFISKATFPIKYVLLERSGKHIALNRLFHMARGEYAIGLDSDDTLISDAIQKGVDIWESIPNKDDYWIVSGRSIDGDTGNIVGPEYPEGINNLPLDKHIREVRKIGGEKTNMRKLSILKNYQFPEIRDIRYISEGYLWWQIDAKYKQYCTNEIFRVYFQSRDALSRLPPNYEGEYTRYHNLILFINDIYGDYRPLLSKNFFISCVSLWLRIFYLKKGINEIRVIDGKLKKSIMLGFFIPAYIYYKIRFKYRYR